MNCQYLEIIGDGEVGGGRWGGWEKGSRGEGDLHATHYALRTMLFSTIPHKMRDTIPNVGKDVRKAHWLQKPKQRLW